GISVCAQIITQEKKVNELRVFLIRGGRLFLAQPAVFEVKIERVSASRIYFDRAIFSNETSSLGPLYIFDLFANPGKPCSASPLPNPKEYVSVDLPLGKNVKVVGPSKFGMEPGEELPGGVKNKLFQKLADNRVHVRILTNSYRAVREIQIHPWPSGQAKQSPENRKKD